MPILLWHDLIPAVSPLGPLLRRMIGGSVVAINEGSRMEPLDHAALLRHIEQHAPAQVFTARNAMLARGTDGTEQVRSLAVLAHPVLQVLRQAERTVASEEKAHGEPATPSATTARLVSWLTAQRPGYPFASLQAGLYLATPQALPGGRPLRPAAVPAVVERLGDPVMPVLLDFPELLAASISAALDAAGIPVASGPVTPPAPRADLAETLLEWRQRLPAAPFATLCELNGTDLLLLDAVVASHAERMGLSEGQRAYVRDALDRAAAITGHRRAVASPAPRLAVVPRPDAALAATPQTTASGTIEPDAVLGWRNRAHANVALKVLGRQVVHDTDAAGCRIVVGQPAAGERTLSIYGCSNVFGWGVPSDETFASMLQAGRPAWRVENFGVQGYGTVHAVMALQRNLRWTTPDYVTICWSAEHRPRNVADVAFVLSRTPRDRPGAGERADLPTHTPRACLNEDGQLVFKSVRLPRPDLQDLDLVDFVPDPFYMDLISFKLVEMAARMVRQAGGHFFLSVLRSGLSPLLTRWLDEAGIPTVEATLPPSASYTNLPDDGHPNAAGHTLFASRIEAHLHACELARHTAKLAAAPDIDA